MDIREFLEARLAEDEQAAREVPEQCRSWSLAASATVFDGEDTWYVIDQRNGRHIVRHDPARVLRDVEAARRLLAQHQAVCDEVRSPKSAEHRMNARARQFALDEVLVTLALPYSDHPDYHKEWSP